MPRASRVAALIKDSLGVETDLQPGGRGEFTVWVGELKVAEKSRNGFPADSTLIQAVETALE